MNENLRSEIERVNAARSKVAEIIGDQTIPQLVEKCIELNKTSRCCLGCGRDHDESHKQDCLIYGEEWWADRPERADDRKQCLGFSIIGGMK